MADIIVLVPRKQIEHFWKDVAEIPGHEMEEFWALGRTPTRLCAGDHVWFQIDGQLVAKAKIDRITHQDKESCIDTNKVWQGSCFLYWKPTNFVKLDKPITGQANLKRGFMYKESK